MTNFNVTMISDNVCPWCYVGKRRLQQAIALYKEKHPEDKPTFTFEQRAFYLDPNAPKVGVDKQQRYAEKFGSPERAAEIFSRLNAAGESAGIKFNFSGKTGNTRDSHRIVEFAKTKGEAVQLSVIDHLLAGYFEEAKDITSHEFLVEAAVAGGLSESETKTLLNSDRYAADVDKQYVEARQLGVSGVPYFILNDQYAVEGGQAPEAFVQLFERLKQKQLA